MIMSMQGARYDGREWPGYNGLLDVPEWEANDLINSGLAELPDEEPLNRNYEVLREPDPDFEYRLKYGMAPEQAEEEDDDFGYEEPDDEDDDFDRDSDDEPAEQEPVAEKVHKPKTTDNKAAWLVYANSLGANIVDGESVTKAHLVSSYGTL